MKKYIAIIGLFILVLSLVFFNIELFSKKTTEEIEKPLVTISDKNIKTYIFSQNKKLDVGENEIIIKVEGGSLESLYMYMPPMPGMGEMREDATINEISNSTYKAKINISMAGSWQIIAQVNGNILKTDVSIPFEVNKKHTYMEKNNIEVDKDKLQILGIQTQKVVKDSLSDTFSTVGYVSYDLSKLYHVTIRTDSWVLDTFSRFEGEYIKKGTPLIKILSPDVKIAEEELKLSKEIDKDLEKLSKEKLNYLKTGEIVHSPVEGIIIEKRINHGSYLKAGDVAYTIANTNFLWIIAEVPQNLINYVERGHRVVITPVGDDNMIDGIVDYIFPIADKESKTAKVRIKVKSKNLKINQVVDVMFENSLEECLIVPEDAVVDTGKRQVVFVKNGDGIFQPRVVKLGKKSQGHYQVLDGLKEGEEVVVKGAFLLDAEAQIKGIYGNYE